ncbi:alpha-tocopherol transfer protein-like [Eupeodes corollae]|uniref:alpha-tocopherol transfer protein-like n=1 Tax=Eupeodes corollae TaxID=290404 RepID=UPI00249057D6|nr:alpha-tocopherol transfer protein-like [Eupeodes corollae]
MSNLRPLTPLLALRAKEELNEVPERIDDDLKAFREWIAKQPHLNARTDDQFLMAFLRGCKHSLEKAKHKLDMFYTMRGIIPELYKNRSVDDPKVLGILRSGCLIRLPSPLGEDGPRIHVTRYGMYDSHKFTIADVMKTNTFLQEIEFVEDDNAMVKGFIEIIDFKGVTGSHMLQFDPTLVRKLAALGDKAWPYRQKGFHLVNVPSGTETILTLVRSFLSEKIKKRFHIHKKYESLYEHVPEKYLPVEYGGKNGTIQDVIDTWEAKLLSYREYFNDEVNYGTNEKLRPGKPMTSETVFGLAGSFRKLDVD